MRGTVFLQSVDPPILFDFQRAHRLRQAYWDGAFGGRGGRKLTSFRPSKSTGIRRLRPTVAKSKPWSVGAFQTITADLNAGRAVEERITPHTLRASRITEWRDEHGWSFSKIARVMGNTADMVEKVYYRPRYDVEEFRAEIEVASDADLPM